MFYLDGDDLPTHDFYQCYMIVVQGKSLLMKKQIRFFAMRILEEEMVTVNLNSCVGAKNVISACRECKVRRLLYNSSADVVFDGSKDILNGDESLAYPWKVCLWQGTFFKFIVEHCLLFDLLKFLPNLVLLCLIQFDDMLSDLKAQAESLILLSNDIDGLLTCVLRPSNVFGPGDTHLMPFLVNLAKSGWGKVFLTIRSFHPMYCFTYTLLTWSLI